MPSYYGNPNYRKKFDAFRIIDQSGHEPLKEAVSCALRLRQSAEYIQKAMEGSIKPETRAQLTIALAKCTPDEFHAWIKIAEFVYSKPKFIEVAGHVTLEQILAKSWDEKPIDMLESGDGNG